MRKKLLKKFAFTAIGILLLPIIILLLFHLIKGMTGFTPEAVKNYANDNIFLEIGVIWGLYFIKSVVFFIPIAFIYLLTGAMFAPVYAILLNILGMAINLSFTFFIGRKLGKHAVQRVITKSQKAQAFMESPQKNNITLFVLRLSGLFPVELISLVCGSTNYKYLSFLGLSLLAMIPGMIPFAMMGKAVSNPFSKEFMIPLFCAIMIMVISLMYYKIKNKE